MYVRWCIYEGLVWSVCTYKSPHIWLRKDYCFSVDNFLSKWELCKVCCSVSITTMTTLTLRYTYQNAHSLLIILMGFVDGNKKYDKVEDSIVKARNWRIMQRPNRGRTEAEDAPLWELGHPPHTFATRLEKQRPKKSQYITTTLWCDFQFGNTSRRPPMALNKNGALNLYLRMIFADFHS